MFCHYIFCVFWTLSFSESHFNFLLEFPLCKAIFFLLALLGWEIGQVQGPAFPCCAWSVHLQQSHCRGNSPARSLELVQDPWGVPLLSFHTLLPACSIPQAVMLARKTSTVLGALLSFRSSGDILGTQDVWDGLPLWNVNVQGLVASLNNKVTDCQVHWRPRTKTLKQLLILVWWWQAAC